MELQLKGEQGDVLLVGIRTLNKYRGLGLNIMNGCTFGQTTIVFGRNGSGKTSITEAIRTSTELSDAQALAQLQFANTTDSQTSKVFVFNRFYVKENLEQFIDASAGVSSIALGSQQIHDKLEKTKVTEEIEDKTAALDKLEEESRRANTEKSVGDSAKTTLISTLGPFEQRFHPTLLKNDRKFQARIASLKDYEEQGPQSADLLQILASRRPEKHELPVLSDISAAVDLVSLKETFGRKPENALASKIAGDAELINWLFEGFHHFTHSAKCPFCAETIPANRLTKLQATFNDEHAEIKSSCSSLREGLSGQVEALKALKTNLGASYLPDPNLNRELESEIPKIKKLLVNRISDLEKLISLIDLKDSDPSIDITFPEVDFTSISLQSIRKLQARYDKYVSSYESRRTEAIRELESRTMAQFSEKIVDTRKEVVDRNNSIETLRTRIVFLKKRLQQLVAAESDTSAMADQISNVLRLHLGREDLEVRSTGKEYRIFRNGTPAEFLSDGERNLISFVYFLKSVNDVRYTSFDKIVVIDDPVNSMDGENLAACISLISEERKQWKQTILLTHNFEFLKSSMRVLGSDGLTDSELTLLHTAPEWDETEEVTGWTLEVMPETLRIFSSEYHYLFWSVAAAASGLLDPHHLMSLGNSGRRLLEGFLSFKRPATPDLRQSLEATWKCTEHHEELRPIATRTLAVMNHRSHEQSPTPSSAGWPLVTPTDFRALLYTICHVDKEHFDQMVRATKFDQADVSADFKRAMKPYARAMGALNHGRPANIKNLMS